MLLGNFGATEVSVGTAHQAVFVFVTRFDDDGRFFEQTVGDNVDTVAPGLAQPAADALFRDQ